jgi:hypothetical protein
MFGLKPRSETGMTVEEYAEARRVALRFKMRVAVREFATSFVVFSILFALGGIVIWVRAGFRFPIFWTFVVIFGACAAACALLVSGIHFLFTSPLARVKR